MRCPRSFIACLLSVLACTWCVGGCEQKVVGVRNDWTSTDRGFGEPRRDDDPYGRVNEVDLRGRVQSNRPPER